MKASINATDRAIVNALQRGFPVTERPFRDVAAGLGLGEEELIERVDRLLAEGTLTRFGPLFDAERLGGAFLLAALEVPDAQFDRVVARINAFPEVAHNYARDHPLNVWFVIAVENPQALPDVVARIERATGLEVHAFPKEREYFVELLLDA